MTMTPVQILAHLRAANDVAREAAAHGHHPFGAVLVGPDDRVVVAARDGGWKA
jgi:tRNA(Arg) A34 adenosine deaminase TadA